MATSNNSLRVADLDFFSIRNNLKNYLRSQSEFTDYDFEGSGMSVLLDVLSYNTYYNSFYLNMAANESFLDTAQIRQNILSHAKLINYVPSSSQGSLVKTNIKVTPEGTEPSPTYVVLDKYTKILGQDKDGVNYPFVTLNSNTAFISNGSYSFANVMIKQGEVVSHQFFMTANNTARRFSIPSSNVDTTTLVVRVIESSSNNYTKEFKPSTDITELTSNSYVYFVEEDQDLNYSVYFGDGVLGYKPKNGNIINITYLDNIGAISNNISKFVFIDKIGGVYSNNVKITSVSGSYGGVDKETPEQIRFRAPYFYSAQNRCVTVNDYESLITKDYQNIDAVSVWGGEDNDPVVYGKVYMSLKTKGYYTLTNLEKEQIKQSIISNRSVLTIIPEIVDPDYIFIQVRGKVTYDPRLTSRTAGELQQIVKQAINNYNINELNTFKSTFRKSKLAYYIEQSEPSITGSDIFVYLQSRKFLTLNQSRNYEIKYNAPLQKGTFLEKLFSYPQITVLDSSFTSRDVFFEEVPESFTGIDSVEIINSGVNYNNPTVTITGDGIGATVKATVVNGKIRSIDVVNRGSGYSRAYVSIVDDRNGSEAIASVKLEAKNGVLRTYYYKDNGEKVIVNSNAGTINYDTGLVVLTSLRPNAVSTNQFYESDVITVSAVPDGEIIPPLRNRILTIEEDNAQSIQIEMVAQSS